ncbi:MAG: hypothetical protein KAV43_00315 [Hadesarchaea archaeon]|nr:hypothetical protein [Hadesarchaea archaeon]
MTRGRGRFEEACLKKEFYVYLPSIDFMPGKIISRLWKLYFKSEDVWERRG